MNKTISLESFLDSMCTWAYNNQKQGSYGETHAEQVERLKNMALIESLRSTIKAMPELLEAAGDLVDMAKKDEWLPYKHGLFAELEQAVRKSTKR